MFLYLSKLLPLLVYPVGVTIVACLLALFFLYTGSRKLAATFLSFGLVVLWAASTPLVAGALFSRLENQHPPLADEHIPISKCIIVLGGAVGFPAPPRVDVELNEAADRVLKAARLYRQGKGTTVIVAAGNLPWMDAPMSEARLIRDLLIEWGVEESDILLDGGSRNTYENAINSKQILDQTDCDTPLLVTSAFHMGRAVATFEKLGVPVVPVSVDVHMMTGSGVTIFDFLPSAEALMTTTLAMKEWLGRRVYEFREWN